MSVKIKEEVIFFYLRKKIFQSDEIKTNLLIIKIDKKKTLLRFLCVYIKIHCMKKFLFVSLGLKRVCVCIFVCKPVGWVG